MWGVKSVPGGFDSHMSPPKERKKNMGMNQTPVSERVHIGFFGKRNAGKSSVMNAVTGQDLAVVSDVKGTTTDPVYKTMELLPLGPVVMMDTPGIDDEGELGELRVKKSYQVLNKTDIAVVVIDGTCGVSEEDLKITERIQKKNIPYIIVLNKCERFTQEDERLRVQENTASYLKTEKECFKLTSVLMVQVPVSDTLICVFSKCNAAKQAFGVSLPTSFVFVAFIKPFSSTHLASRAFFCFEPATKILPRMSAVS